MTERERRTRPDTPLADRLAYVFTRRRGANTAHTQMGRPTHEAPTREYTHKHKQTHSAARQSTVRAHAVVPPSSSRRAPRPHTQRAASLSRSPTPKLCAPPPRGAVTAARATSTSSSSLHSRTTAAWGCFYTDNSTRKGGTVQRGLPRGSFEQNEADEYHTGFADTPGGARSDPLEAVDRGVPPKLARVESVAVVAPR